MRSHAYIHRSRCLISCALLLGLLLGAAGGGINTRAGSEEWRPIEASDLALKTPMVDPDADAEAIFWDIRVDDGGDNDLVLSHYIRIKIFTDRGREKQSKIEIPFFTGTKIKDVAARTIKPDGSIIELAKQDFIEKTIIQISGRKLRSKNFTFPAIEPGSIIEYKWREVISDASANLLRLYFQRDIPVQNITYHIKPSSSSSSFNVIPFNMARPNFQKEKNGFQAATITWMSAFREEPLMPPKDNVVSWVMVEYYNVFRALLGYSAAAMQVHFGFQPFLKVDDEITRKSAEIVAGATSPEEKLERIFAFCRTNIKNTSDKSSGLTADAIEKLKDNKKPADTLKRGVGRWIDINLLFAALANAAGLEARVALLPDRSTRFFDATVVIPGALRPSSVGVRVGTTWKFFSPGFPHSPPGMLRWQEEGVAALLADDSPEWLMTPLSPPQKSKQTSVANLELNEDGTLEGDVSVEYTGHLAVERRLLNDDDSPAQREENLKEAVKKRLSTAELTNITIENLTEPTRPFVYKYHVRVPGYAQRTGKRLFLQPAFFQKGISALFELSARRYPVYFPYAWSEQDKVTIKIPKGFNPDNPDSPGPINAGAISRYAVNMGMAKDGSSLTYQRSFSFGGHTILLFPVANYPQLKLLFDEINKSDNHTIAFRQAGQ